jgi:hypothetical protein
MEFSRTPPKFIDLRAPIFNTLSRRGFLDAILKTRTKLWFPWNQLVVHLVGVIDLMG